MSQHCQCVPGQNEICIFCVEVVQETEEPLIINAIPNTVEEVLTPPVPEWTYAEKELFWKGLKVLSVENWHKIAESVGTKNEQECVDYYNGIQHISDSKYSYNDMLEVANSLLSDRAKAPSSAFNPNETDIIASLNNKIAGKAGWDWIKILNFFDDEPQSLSVTNVPTNKDDPNSRKEWFFFHLRKNKFRKGGRSNRSNRTGTWKPSGKATDIKNRNKEVVGSKNIHTFYHCEGRKSDWVVKEYKTKATGPDNQGNELVLCRLYNKSSNTAKKDLVGKKVEVALVKEDEKANVNEDTNVNVEIEQLINETGFDKDLVTKLLSSMIEGIKAGQIKTEVDSLEQGLSFNAQYLLKIYRIAKIQMSRENQ